MYFAQRVACSSVLRMTKTTGRTIPVTMEQKASKPQGIS
jgi:hypothetical protein